MDYHRWSTTSRKRQIQPIADLSRSELPGGIKCAASALRKVRIEIEMLHASTLVELAEEFGVAVPAALMPMARLMI